jgi:hypothetical protein
MNLLLIDRENRLKKKTETSYYPFTVTFKINLFYKFYEVYNEVYNDY